MSREDVEKLLTVRRLVEERIERLSFELEGLRHALERVKTILKFDQAMRGDMMSDFLKTIGQVKTILKFDQVMKGEEKE